jgi:hypothetical protein
VRGEARLRCERVRVDICRSLLDDESTAGTLVADIAGVAAVNDVAIA